MRWQYIITLALQFSIKQLLPWGPLNPESGILHHLSVQTHFLHSLPSIRCTPCFWACGFLLRRGPWDPNLITQQILYCTCSLSKTPFLQVPFLQAASLLKKTWNTVQVLSFLHVIEKKKGFTAKMTPLQISLTACVWHLTNICSWPFTSLDFGSEAEHAALLMELPGRTSSSVIPRAEQHGVHHSAGAFVKVARGFDSECLKTARSHARVHFKLEPWTFVGFLHPTVWNVHLDLLFKHSLSPSYPPRCILLCLQTFSSSSKVRFDM